MVEALGFRWALTVAKEKGGDKFLFDEDALGIIQMLQGVRATNSSLSVIIRDTTNIANSFSDVSFSFVPRDCNRVEAGM